MRTLIALAFAAALGVTAAHAGETGQVAAKEPASATAAARTEPVTKSEARDIAQGWLKENKYRFGRVGEIRTQDGVVMVELKSGDGIRFKTLKIDAATGQVIG